MNRQITLKNVKKIFINPDLSNLVYIDFNKELIGFDLHIVKEIWKYKLDSDNIGGEYFCKNSIALWNYSGKCNVINAKSGKLDDEIFKLYPDFVFTVRHGSNAIFLRSNMIKMTQTTGLYDFTYEKIIWERECINDLWGINEKGIYARSDKLESVEFYSLEYGRLLWQFSVSEIGKYTWSDGVKTHREEGKVERIIGVFGEILVVVITGGGERVRANTQLIGLDTNTGILLWQIDQFEGTPNRQLPATATLMSDAQNKNLIGFQSGDFIEIDPQAGKVLRYSHINLVYEQYTLLPLIDSFSLVGNYLYFRTSVSSMGGFPTAIGAFNYKTETIEWLHVFEEFAKEGKFIPINQPKAEGNRVYALDSGNTLHIFEREQ